MLTYIETIEYSGNSLVQVVIMGKSIATNDIRDIFNSLDCKSEKFKEGYFVIEVLADKQYEPIKQKLSELQDKGIIDYAEPVLSEQHQYSQKAAAYNMVCQYGGATKICSTFCLPSTG